MQIELSLLMKKNENMWSNSKNKTFTKNMTIFVCFIYFLSNHKSLTALTRFESAKQAVTYLHIQQLRSSIIHLESFVCPPDACDSLGLGLYQLLKYTSNS